jgi:FKBP-type peptidyl-prolyl cis-trans isomerase
MRPAAFRSGVARGRRSAVRRDPNPRTRPSMMTRCLSRFLVLALFTSWTVACTRGLPAPPDVAAPPADSLKTTSGLSLKWLQKGNGTRHPRATDRVTVHYTGWTTDGKMFDSSVTRGEPSSFQLNEVIDGWTEGVQRMVEGDKVRLWIPEDLAYRGAAGSPQGMLVFDIELIRIEG